MSVDFPAPFSPTRPTVVPRSTSRSMPLSTGTPKNAFSMPWNWRIRSVMLARPSNLLQRQAPPDDIEEGGEEDDRALDDGDVEVGHVEQ